MNENYILENNGQAFLQEGGEMGEYIRSINWADTPMGEAKQWPIALKQTVSMMLSTTLPVLICWGKDYTQLYNDAFRPINGTKHPTAMGDSAKHTYAEIWDTIGPMFEQVMQGESVGFPNFMVTLERNGQLENCYFDFSYSPIRDLDGNIGGILVICIETTQFKQDEEKSAKLAAIIESSDDAIISKTLESTITSWNESAVRILGYTASEIVGEKIYKLIPEDRKDEEPKIISRLKNGERVEHFETKRLTKSGKLIDVSLTISPVKNKEGQIIGISKIMRDITYKKQEEQRKNDFVAVVSHELKTPLTTIHSYIQLLLAKSKKEANDFNIKALTRAEVQTKKMSLMINDFLSVARLEEGEMSIHKKIFEFQALANESIQDVQFLSSKHHIEFVNCESIWLNGDRDKLGQVLNNLLTNAIKYAPNGGNVTLACKKQAENVIISVRDEGIGINLEDQKHLFERFYRANNEKLKTVSGFGIGLYLVSEILRRHDSKIEVVSNEDIGSTFYFSLPFMPFPS
ncbi:PAS domain S-box protein [Pedobacter insulae]|uniref:histidine kinase n=1 Tax=Pedobacter insulae TaxID=414048 RepID=A0A1I2Z9Q2_9SPHI|nr:PAS domain S-box protein [Pedobacter insulae]SFH34592.1 PAS domain S-box-containing protein [Pedobacter insulae]